MPKPTIIRSRPAKPLSEHKPFTPQHKPNPGSVPPPPRDWNQRDLQEEVVKEVPELRGQPELVAVLDDQADFGGDAEEEVVEVPEVEWSPKMLKAELLEVAEVLGLEVTAANTKTEIIEALEAATS